MKITATSHDDGSITLAPMSPEQLSAFNAHAFPGLSINDGDLPSYNGGDALIIPASRAVAAKASLKTFKGA